MILKQQIFAAVLLFLVGLVHPSHWFDLEADELSMADPPLDLLDEVRLDLNLAALAFQDLPASCGTELTTCTGWWTGKGKKGATSNSRTTRAQKRSPP